MEKLNEQQLRALAELPYNEKYADVMAAAEEELNRRSLITKQSLAAFEHKYFIIKQPTRIKVVKTTEWEAQTMGKFTMHCESFEFTYDNPAVVPSLPYITASNSACKWYSDQIGYFKQAYTEITEEVWLHWSEKFNKFYSAAKQFIDEE